MLYLLMASSQIPIFIIFIPRDVMRLPCVTYAVRWNAFGAPVLMATVLVTARRIQVDDPATLLRQCLARQPHCIQSRALSGVLGE